MRKLRQEIDFMINDEKFNNNILNDIYCIQFTEKRYTSIRYIFYIK